MTAEKLFIYGSREAIDRYGLLLFDSVATGIE